jgi:tetratricopeptide (TPR) repeat protein
VSERVPAGDRGDWNACTVEDPSRDLNGCRALVDPAASGASGRAAAHLADGLSLAWKGELVPAIRAFDRAIAIAPRSSFAYLNRGLAHRLSGNEGRALADLDQAVRHAPRSARAYYHRSLLLRRKGDLARARADEARAVELDSRYGALAK